MVMYLRNEDVKNKRIDLNRFFISNFSKEPIRGNESIGILPLAQRGNVGGVLSLVLWFTGTFAYSVSHSGLVWIFQPKGTIMS